MGCCNYQNPEHQSWHASHEEYSISRPSLSFIVLQTTQAGGGGLGTRLTPHHEVVRAHNPSSYVMDIFSAYQELKEYVNRVTIATCTAVNSQWKGHSLCISFIYWGLASSVTTASISAQQTKGMHAYELISTHGSITDGFPIHTTPCC